MLFLDMGGNRLMYFTHQNLPFSFPFPLECERAALASNTGIDNMVSFRNQAVDNKCKALYLFFEFRNECK
jgi:hypothetical protein